MLQKHRNEELTTDAFEESVGLVAINGQHRPLTNATIGVRVAPTMCNLPKYQRLVATIVEEWLELAAIFVEEELELVAPFLPINRHQERAAKFEQRREQERNT